MATQRKKRQATRRSPSKLRGNDPGERRGNGPSSSGSNLTNTLIGCLILAFAFLFFLLYLYNTKATPISKNLVEQKPAIKPIPPKVVVEPVVEEEKTEVVAKTKKNKPLVDDTVKSSTKEPKKSINLEISGSEKKTEQTKPAEIDSVKAPTKKPVNDDEPVLPKSFMGGVTNPEMEKAKPAEVDQDKDREREERRKKKEYELE